MREGRERCGEVRRGPGRVGRGSGEGRERVGRGLGEVRREALKTGMGG